MARRPSGRRPSLWLAAAFLLTLPVGSARGESWSDSLQIKPIVTPIDLRYRPVAKATIVLGRVAIEQIGIRMPRPVVRGTKSMRIVAVRDKFAVSFEPVGGDARGDAASGMRTMRLLIDAKGELFDAVVLDDNGEPTEMDGPLLAEIAPSLFLALPRFPDHPVRTGDIMYDYVLDAGYDLGLGSGTLPLKVKGTVRGTTEHNGRLAVVIEYQGSGECTCGPLSVSEHGYELIDVATGVVLAITSTSRMVGREGSVRWTEGIETSLH